MPVMLLATLLPWSVAHAQQADPALDAKRLEGPFPKVVVSVPWSQLAKSRREKAAAAAPVAAPGTPDVPQAAPDTVRHVRAAPIGSAPDGPAPLNYDAPAPTAASRSENEKVLAAGRASVPDRAAKSVRPKVAAPRRLSDQPYQAGVDVVQISSLQRRPRNHRPLPDEKVLILERNLRQLLIIEDETGRFRGLWMQVPGIKKELDEPCRNVIAESRRRRQYLREVPRSCRIEQLRRVSIAQAALLGRAPDGTVKSR